MSADSLTGKFPIYRRPYLLPGTLEAVFVPGNPFRFPGTPAPHFGPGSCFQGAKLPQFAPGNLFLICAPKVGHKQKVNEKKRELS